MRHQSLFYSLFPPPKFLTMPHAGLEISDDALRCIEYRSTPHGLVVSKFAKAELPPNLIDGGNISDEKQFIELLKAFVRVNKLSYVKVSLPEEKVYLFQLDIPSTEVKAITQHVEFKLEENVPLPASEAVFYFDILPASVTGGVLRASVSVVPKTYVEKMLSILHGMKLTPMAFEVAPKSIAKAVIPNSSDNTYLIVHVMNKKIGTYIVSGGVVCFSSTIAWGGILNIPSDPEQVSLAIDPVMREIQRVYTYWATRPDAHSKIAEILVVGKGAATLETMFHTNATAGLPPLATEDIWRNAFDIHKYIPAISREDSLEYAVAAGLALPS